MICATCLLPDTFPGINFDDKGVCQHCRQFAGKQEQHEEDKNRYAAKFLDLLDRINDPDQRSRRSHDILMAYSGGKDSTYTMSLLRNKYGLRVLAVSFDNGFVSPRAVENIKRVTDELGVDHIFFKPRWDLLKKIFTMAAQRELYPKKTLERASTICTSCMGLVKTVCLRMAIEQEIPMIGYGWSPGQAPVQSSIMKTNPALMRMAQQTILGPLREVAGREIEGYFLREMHYAKVDFFPWNVHPMAWEFYEENLIVHKIQKLGWVAPDDTDSNSTNCLLNAFANELHVSRYGFHPYVWEIANMVREGVMTADEGRLKFSQTPSNELIARVRKKLGV